MLQDLTRAATRRFGTSGDSGSPNTGTILPKFEEEFSEAHLSVGARLATFHAHLSPTSPCTQRSHQIPVSSWRNCQFITNYILPWTCLPAHWERQLLSPLAMRNSPTLSCKQIIPFMNRHFVVQCSIFYRRRVRNNGFIYEGDTYLFLSVPPELTLPNRIAHQTIFAREVFWVRKFNFYQNETHLEALFLYPSFSKWKFG